jgi:hypothetical protein
MFSFYLTYLQLPSEGVPQAFLFFTIL